MFLAQHVLLSAFILFTSCKAGSRENYDYWNHPLQQYDQPPPNPSSRRSSGHQYHQAPVYDLSSLPMQPEGFDSTGLSAFPMLNLGGEPDFQAIQSSGDIMTYGQEQHHAAYQLPPSDFAAHHPYIDAIHGQMQQQNDGLSLPQGSTMMMGGHELSTFHPALPSIRTTMDRSSTNRNGGSGSMTSRVGSSSRGSRGKSVMMEEEEEEKTLPYQAQTARLSRGPGQQGYISQVPDEVVLLGDDEQLREGEEELLHSYEDFFQQLWSWKAIDTRNMSPLQVAEKAAEIRWSFKDDVDMARLFGAWSGRRINRETRVTDPSFHTRFKVQNERFRRRCSELRRRMAIQPRKYPDEAANDAEGLALIRSIAAAKYTPRRPRKEALSREEVYDEQAKEVWQEFCTERSSHFPGRDMLTLTAEEIEQASRGFKYRGYSRQKLANFFRHFMQAHLGMDADAIQLFDFNREQAEMDRLQTLRLQREQRWTEEVEHRVGREH